ncbi:hypothetical protein ACFE04_025082 [Oxalis oulophora]
MGLHSIFSFAEGNDSPSKVSLATVDFEFDNTVSLTLRAQLAFVAAPYGLYPTPTRNNTPETSNEDTVMSSPICLREAGGGQGRLERVEHLGGSCPKESEKI